jgi:Na+-driven multidrug efflux pump
MILFTLVITAIYLLFSDQILLMVWRTQEILPYARDFTHIILLVSVFGAIAFGINNLIRAEGNPRIAMATQLVGTFINIILNYIFIFKLGLGIKGFGPGFNMRAGSFC